jgi:hypothetical protein
VKYHQRTVLGGQKQTENPTPTGNFKKLNPFRMHRRLNAIYRSALREVFKRFYQDATFQQLVSSGTKPYNPWKHWFKCNLVAGKDFLESFKVAIHGVMKNGYGVDVAKLNVLEVKVEGCVEMFSK